uniref:Pyridine nucleotide-disulphide oxidoreductase domain 1 n=1 Tax=Astyanax mexicanus TaxID=7994 RepID=A0A8B9K4H1_ASTMX
SCLLTLALLTAAPLVKTVTNFKQVSKTLEDFDVEEQPSSILEEKYPNLKVIQSAVRGLHADQHTLQTENGQIIHYEKLCICTGGRPKLLNQDTPNVLGIRDTDSAQEFQKHLSKAKRMLVVGNGGIALELVIYSIFIYITFMMYKADKPERALPCKRARYTTDKTTASIEGTSRELGSALGPDWHEGISLRGTEEVSHRVHLDYECEIEKIYSQQDFLQSPLYSQKSQDLGVWPVYAHLTNGKTYGCDFIVSATGVVPNTEPFLKGNKFELAEDRGLRVNDHMQTSEPDVYAAGDVCTAGWEHSALWQQMRLWTQARQMGWYAARCIAAEVSGEAIELDFCFELFSHITKFFNYKVMILFFILIYSKRLALEPIEPYFSLYIVSEFNEEWTNRNATNDLK